MEAIIVAIMQGLATLGPLIAQWVNASKEQEAQILAEMKTAVANMTAALNAGGTMDQAIAAEDAKVDADIAATAAKLPGSGSGLGGAPVATKP